MTVDNNLGRETTMRIVTTYDVAPTSDRRHPDYNPANDPELNIQYTYNQAHRTTVVEKTDADRQKLDGFLFGDEQLPSVTPTIEDNVLNHAMVDYLWNLWGDDNQTNPTQFAESIGLPFQLNRDQLRHLETQMVEVGGRMADAFLQIYRNYKQKE